MRKDIPLEPPGNEERQCIVHDVMTHLTIIKAHAQIIKRRVECSRPHDPEDVLARMGSIDASINRLRHCLSVLLD